PARRAEAKRVDDRWPHDAPSRVRDQPTETETDRASLRLMKTIGGLRKLRHRGGELVDWVVTFTAAAYNLVRLRTLLARPAGTNGTSRPAARRRPPTNAHGSRHAAASHFFHRPAKH